MNVAWIDLETTGLDEQDGSILEVGVVVADPDGRTLTEAAWLVSPLPHHLRELPPEVYEMHRTSGLLADLEAAPALPLPGDVDLAVAALLDRHTVDGRIILAGSGVSHFDVRWIARHLPATCYRLTYWTYDVGVIRRLLATIDPDLPRPANPKAHRALPDARDHRDEWHHYRTLLRDCHGGPR